MNTTPLHDEIRRTAAGLMAVLDVEQAGEQLVRLYGEQAVADALTPVADAVRAGAAAPSFTGSDVDGTVALRTPTVRVVRRRAADQAPRGRAGLMSLAQAWQPQDRAPRGAARHDWL